MEDKKGQIWIETAIYTLIGLTIIAIVLSIATPQIEKSKERAILSQTADALNILNNEIQKIEQSEGTVKIINLKITKGRLEIDSKKNRTVYILEDTKLEFSEENQTIKEGDLYLTTSKSGRRFDVSLELKHEGLNITFNGNKKLKVLHGAGVPYKIRIENLGAEDFGLPINIDFSLV